MRSAVKVAATFLLLAPASTTIPILWGDLGATRATIEANVSADTRSELAIAGLTIVAGLLYLCTSALLRGLTSSRQQRRTPRGTLRLPGVHRRLPVRVRGR